MFRNGAKTAVPLAALGGIMVEVGSPLGRRGAIVGLILGLAPVGFSSRRSHTAATRAARAIPNVAAWTSDGDADRVVRLRGSHV